MKKALFFPHDFNARNDPKMLKLRRKLGPAGKGIYWDLVESLYEEGGRLDWAAAEEVAYLNRTEFPIVEQIIKNFGLFEFDDSGFWSASQQERQRHIEEVSEARRQAGRAPRKRFEKPAELPQNEANDKQMLNNSQANDEQLLPIINKINKIDKIDKKEKIDKINTNAQGQIFTTLDNPSAEEGAGATKKLSTDECKEIAKRWNAVVVRTGATFSRIQALGEERCNKIRVRWQEFSKVGNPAEVLDKIFANACASTFLQGGGNGSWRADFDWIFKNSKNWVKIYEGDYNDDDTSRKRPTQRGIAGVGDTGTDAYDGRF